MNIKYAILMRTSPMQAMEAIFSACESDSLDDHEKLMGFDFLVRNERRFMIANSPMSTEQSERVSKICLYARANRALLQGNIEYYHEVMLNNDYFDDLQPL